MAYELNWDDNPDSKNNVKVNDEDSAPNESIISVITSESTMSSLSKPLLIECDPPSRNPNFVPFYRAVWFTKGTMDDTNTTTNKTWVRLDASDSDEMHYFYI